MLCRELKATVLDLVGLACQLSQLADKLMLASELS